MQKKIVFITGASGTGKTTLLNNLQLKYANRGWNFSHFDSDGVPSINTMIRDYGSPEKWQEKTTGLWIERLAGLRTSGLIFLEGQANIRFILRGFQKFKVRNFAIVLIDCHQDIMKERLSGPRNQPELYTENMRIWLKFLRDQAGTLEIPAIDTSFLTENQVLALFERIIGIPAS